MKLLFRAIALSAIISVVFTQDFGRLKTPLIEDEQQEQEQEQEPVPWLNMQSEVIALEKAIDPTAYVLGPGDEIGLNILTHETITISLVVTPTGDLFIPSVGVCHVAGLTLSEAIEKVRLFIHEKAYPKAQSHMVLLNTREFKLLVSGAVNLPGFVIITPLTRLDGAVAQAEGFHQLAKEFEIEITRKNGQSEIINFHKYLLDGDLSANPTFLEGDRIRIPFGEIVDNGIVVRGSITGAGYDIISDGETLGNYIKRQVVFSNNTDLENVTISREASSSASHLIIDPNDFNSTVLHAGDVVNFMWERGVTVTGFVQDPGGFTYYPGFSVSDYISLAGGNMPNGNPRRATIHHLDGRIDRSETTVLLRGDIIYVPRTNKDIFIGNMSVLAVVTAMLTIYLTYLRTTGY